MKLEWEQTVSSADAYTSLLQLVADCCLAAEGVSQPCAVHVLLTDDETIHRYNVEQRGVDRATDVLSFPSVNYASGHTARSSEAALRREFDPDCGGAMLGDIVISLEHAKAQGEEYGHGLKRELCYLLAHGIFHLCGYDHMEPQEQKEMRRMEEKALQLAGVSRDGNVITPTDNELLMLAREAMQRSYSPYSHYKVGACLLSEDGRLFQGCNIENASFGLTNCAERTALFKAVSEGATNFTTIAIAAEGSAPWPCGACRQALNEFAPGIRVIVTWKDGQIGEAPLSQLLPHGFGPKELV